MATKVVSPVASASVIHGRAVCGEQTNPKYVAVAPTVAVIDAWPEKNDNALSVLALE